MGSFSNRRALLLPFSRCVCVHFIASLGRHTLGVCHTYQSAAAKGVFRMKTSPVPPRPGYSTRNTHRELGSVPAAHCSQQCPGLAVDCAHRSVSTQKTPPGSGKPKGNLGDGMSWMWGKKKKSQRAALDAEWWECHRIFLGSLIPSSESKEETRNLGLQECECRRVYTGNNPRVVVEGSR